MTKYESRKAIQRYENRDVADTDYLLGGSGLTVDNANLSASKIEAFAYGSQPLRTPLVETISVLDGK